MDVLSIFWAGQALSTVNPRKCPQIAGYSSEKPPTRPLYPDVSGAYASHCLPIIARYFLERRTIGIGLRHVRRLRLLSGVDFSRPQRHPRRARLPPLGGSAPIRLLTGGLGLGTGPLLPWPRGSPPHTPSPPPSLHPPPELL